MSKATEVIEADHREIERLFDRYPNEANMGLAQNICGALEQHTRMEEAVLYPELERVDRARYDDAVQEHAEAARLIEEIRDTADPELLAALIAQLHHEVVHHVQDEEREDLPLLESALGEERMDELGAELERWSDEQRG